MARATSCGCAIFRSAIVAVARGMAVGSSIDEAAMGVSTHPGQTQFTRPIGIVNGCQICKGDVANSSFGIGKRDGIGAPGPGAVNALKPALAVV